jgi:hypothetical protein
MYVDCILYYLCIYLEIFHSFLYKNFQGFTCMMPLFYIYRTSRFYVSDASSICSHLSQADKVLEIQKINLRLGHKNH